MFQVKDHKFSSFFSSSTKQVSTTVQVREVISGDYGLYVWPSAIVMAEFVWKSQASLLDKVILELGAGTGLPSLVASTFATKQVFITDYAKAEETLNNLKYLKHLKKKSCNFFFEKPKHNCEINASRFKNIRPEVFGLTWGEFSLKALTIEPPDVIIGADCFYDNSAEFDNILATVSFYLKKKQNSYFLTTYQVRSANRSIAYLLEKWSLEAQTIPLSSFMDAEKMETLSQEIELVRIDLRNNNTST